MKNDQLSYFEEPEFKKTLAKYEGMTDDNAPAYFDADELTDIAEYYATLGREKEADEAIGLALRLHPNDTDALVFRARLLARQGKLKEAYAVTDLIGDTSDREVIFLHADLLLEEQRWEEADEIFRQLADDEDNSPDTLLEIISDYTGVNQKQYAEKWLKTLTSREDFSTLCEKNQQVRDTLCDFYMTFGNPKMAIPLLRTSLDKYPYSLEHWNTLARCHLQMGNCEEAHEAIDFALAIDDKDLNALILKAFIYRQTDNPKAAVPIYQQLISLDHDSCRFRRPLIEIYIMEKMYEPAIPELLTMINSGEYQEYELAELNAALAICYAGTGKGEAGEEFIRTAQRYNGDDVRVCVSIGQYFLVYEGHDTDAEAAFDRALDNTPADERYTTLMDISSACIGERKFRTATKYFELAIAEYPDRAKLIYSFLTLCYFYLKETDALLHNLAKVKEVTPEVYADLGTNNAIIPDKAFNDLLQVLKNNIASGKIDLNNYL